MKRNVFAAEWFVYEWDEATVLGDVQRTFLRGDRRALRTLPPGIDPKAVIVSADAPAKPFAWMQPIAELPDSMRLIVTDDALLDEIIDGVDGRQTALGDVDPGRDSQPMRFPPYPLIPTRDAVFDAKTLAGRPLEPFEQAAILFVVGLLGAAMLVVWALWKVYGA